MSVLTNLRWAREQRTGDRIAKGVLMVIVAHADREGVATLSYRTIAAEAEIDESTVRRHAVPILVAVGALEFDPGRGRGKSRYRVLVGSVVRALEAPHKKRGYQGRRPAQPALYNAAPSARTTEPEGEGPDERCAGSGNRSAGQQAAEQHKQSDEVEAEVEDRGAPPSPPSGARPHASPRVREAAAGRRRPEHPTAAELDATAVRAPGAHALVAEWIRAGDRKVLSTHRRDLNRAVDELLARRADRDLVLAALDHAHDNPRFINPARMLPAAYSDVERATARARAPTVASLAAATGRVPTTTQRVQGALAHLEPEEP